MISIEYNYFKVVKPRYPLLVWAKTHGGVVVREPHKHGYLGRIISIQFEDEMDAVAFKLMSGL